jgi:hypothetical protein
MALLLGSFFYHIRSPLLRVLRSLFDHIKKESEKLHQQTNNKNIFTTSLQKFITN